MSEDEGWAAIPRGMLRDPEVPQAAKLVYIALQGHVNYRTGLAIVKMSTIAEYLVMSRRTVLRALHELRELGIISWEEQRADGGKRAHHYRLLVAPQFSGKTDVPNSHIESSPVSQGDVPVRHNKKEKSSNEKKSKTSSSEPAASDPAKTGIDDAPSRDVLALCSLLADLIEANGSKRPTIGKGWHTAARLLLTSDGRTVEQVERAIRWCQQDEFWRSNVLSMPKLRSKYDQLRLAAQRTTKSRESRTLEANVDVVRKLQADEQNLIGASR